MEEAAVRPRRDGNFIVVDVDGSEWWIRADAIYLLVPMGVICSVAYGNGDRVLVSHSASEIAYLTESEDAVILYDD